MKEINFEQMKSDVQNFRLIDDTFFEVFARDKKCCQEILRTIMQDDALIVKDVTVQASEQNLYGRSVRLDALCIIGDGRLVNIEIQKANNDDHKKRVRLNSSVLTVMTTQKGCMFKDVPTIVVVYISQYDFLHKGFTVYHVDSVIRETGDLFEDGLERIFVNAQIRDGSKTSRLMTHFLEREVNDTEFPEISRRVYEIKHTEEGVDSMCEIMKKYTDQAQAEGRAEGRYTTICRMIHKGKLSVEDGAEELNIPVSEMRTLLKDKIPY